MKWSKEQLKAIETQDKNLLVSASAGSGKTTVLIERIIRKLLSGAVSLDELLVVTFTEASAKEMKQRLRVKLLEKLHEDPQDMHLRRQLMLLPNAHISTFHAFCNRVIRKYFYLIDADSKYQIGEDMELFLMKDDVLEELFLDLYEAQDANFLRLVDQFTKERSDEELKDIVLKLYDQLRNIPNRIEFEEQVLSYYQNFTSLSDFYFSDELYQSIREEIERAQYYFQTAFRLASLPENDHYYQHTFESDIEMVRHLLRSLERKDYHQMYRISRDMTFARFNSSCSEDCTEETKKIIKDLRDSGRKVLTELKEKYFGFQEESQVKFIKENVIIIESLFDLVHAFEERYKAVKRDRGIVDFNDLEEMTLRIFQLNDGNNEAVNEYQSTFKEILIDEYQDTNSMQEAIITYIARPNNRFMVGDVKQSIYRFRHAEPEIFQEKFHSYRKQESDTNQLINLNANYRSRKEILDFVNFLFMQIMDERIGEIDYDKDAQLKAGATYYPSLEGPLIHFAIINQEDVKEQHEEDLDLKKLEMEAHYVAQQIRELIDQGELVYDKAIDGLRPVRYSDIVILARSVKNEQPIFNDVFKEYQIPLLTHDLPGYFDSIEVLTVTSFLEIIDNPLQDIPLIAVLRSPFYQVGEREFVQITACAKEHRVKSNYFYDKVKNYVKHGKNKVLVDKLSQFLTDLDDYREFSKNEPLTELLYRLYHETNYYDFVKGERGGKQRQANLDLLFDRAKNFEELTNNSLFKFVQLINFLKEQDQDMEQARTVSENEDLVRFMSIHKSKGLEFPIVFVVNLSKRYNARDQREPVLFDKDFGVATSYFDRTYRVSYPSLYQTLIKNQMQRKMLAEEMRLLYVALTRAKERLYLVGTIKSPDTHIRKFTEICFQPNVLIDASLRNVTNYLDLVIMALMRHPVMMDRYDLYFNDDEKTILPIVPDVHFDVISEISLDPEMKEVGELPNQDHIDVEEIERQLWFRYPKYQRATHFAKLSVSDLKRLGDTDSQSYVLQPTQFKKPRFYDQTTAIMRGTVTHQLMQHIDYRKTYQLEDLDALKEELVQKEIISQESASAIDLTDILRFLQQPLVKKMKNADKILKELPFTTLLDASTIYQDYPFTDDVLVQGVMDLLVIFEDKVILIDFKTDRIKDDPRAIKRLKKQYSDQVRYYKEAARKLYPNYKVEAMLYLFSIHQFVTYRD